MAQGMSTVFMILVFLLFGSAPGSGADLDGTEAYELASPWLSDDTAAVVSIARGDVGAPLIEDLLGPLMMADDGAAEVGTLTGLRTDIHGLFETHEVIPGGIDAVVVGAGENGGTAVVFGDIEVPEAVPTVDVGAGSVYEVPLDGLPVPAQIGGMLGTLYAMPIVDPRPGLLIATNLEDLEGFATTGAQHASTGERFPEISSLLHDTGDAWLVAAAVLDDGDFDVPEQQPVPHTLALSLERGVRLSMSGDEHTLETIIGYMQMALTAFRSEAREKYERDDLPPVEQLASIYSYHSAEALVDQFEPQAGDGQLHYEFQAKKGIPWYSYVLSTAISGLGLLSELGDAF